MTEQAITGAQVAERIEELSGIDKDEMALLPKKRHHLWVARKEAMEVQIRLHIVASTNQDDADKNKIAAQLIDDMTPMRLDRHGNWPPQPMVKIYEMFEDEDEIRVYGVAAQVAGTAKFPSEAVFPGVGMRYRISKANPKPVYGVEDMALDTWVQLIADEWTAVDGEVNAAEIATEEEREAVLAYCRTLREGYRIVDLIADLEDELHLVDTEDDEETDEEEPENGTETEPGEVETAPESAPQLAAASAEAATPTPTL
jgi:hypothetical protein